MRSWLDLVKGLVKFIPQLISRRDLWKMENTRRNIFTNKVIIHLNIYSELVEDEAFVFSTCIFKGGLQRTKECRRAPNCLPTLNGGKQTRGANHQIPKRQGDHPYDGPPKKHENHSDVYPCK